MDDKLPYNFQEDAYWADEPEEITKFANLIVACAENRLSPLSAAQKITDELAGSSWQNKAEIDENNEDRPYTTNTALVAILIGSVASSFPPQSIVHERLWSLIESFMLVEKREIPNYFSNKDGAPRSPEIYDRDMRSSIYLWESLSPLSFSSGCERLTELGFTWTGVEKCGSREQQRWRNLSFFMARLTVEGIEDMGWKSALQRLLPEYGMISRGTLGWSGYLAGQVLGAAQWIIPEGHGAWVWRACCQNERSDQSIRVDADQEDDRVVQRSGGANGHEGVELESIGDSSVEESNQERKISKWLFNLKHWKIWKASFQETMYRVDDVRVDELARSEASKALRIMEELERKRKSIKL